VISVVEITLLFVLQVLIYFKTYIKKMVF